MTTSICKSCKAEYPRRNRGKHFCSRACFRKHINGKENPNWKNGSSSKVRILRSRFVYQIKPKALARDNYTCQICSAYGVKLHVDHIVPWHQDETLRFELDNLRAVCVPCHYYLTFRRKMPSNSRWGIGRKASII